MQRRISKTKRQKGLNQLAAEIVRMATGEGDDERALISKVIGEMGRKGGKIGGKKRLQMAPQDRSILAFEAAKARWAKQKKSNLPS